MENLNGVSQQLGILSNQGSADNENIVLPTLVHNVSVFKFPLVYNQHILIQVKIEFLVNDEISRFAHAKQTLKIEDMAMRQNLDVNPTRVVGHPGT